jgi:beta-lactamase regulating signal transducer with metallopeptidase domain
MDLIVRNLVTYSLQIMAVIGMAALAVRLLELPPPRARIWYWRAVIAVCIALPFLPMRRVAPGNPFVTLTVGRGPAKPALTTQARTPVDQRRSPTTVQPVPRSAHSLPAAVLGFLVTGMVIRASWLLVGLCRLRNLRTQGTPATLEEDVLVLHRRLAPHADVRWHEDVTQPVTFGFWRPVILLPHRLRSLPSETRRSVVCHELVHVGRHDWQSLVVEELVRTLFWFHPVVRWALGQLHLSREQAVDALVVAITGTRRAYLDALLIFADEPPLRAGIGLLQPRHLAIRVRAILQDVKMSRSHLLLRGAVLGTTILSSTWAVVSAYPLYEPQPALIARASAQLVQRTTSTSARSQADEILVNVNGESLTAADLERRRLLVRRNATPPTNNDPATTVLPQILVDAINEMLIVQRGNTLGYRLSEEQFTAILGNIRTENKLEAEEPFQAALTREGMTITDLRRNLERQMIYQRVQLNEVLTKIAITDDEARAYYDAHLNEFPLMLFEQAREQVNARLRAQVGQTRGRQELIKYLDTLRSQAVIEWRDPDLQRAYDRGLVQQANTPR